MIIQTIAIQMMHNFFRIKIPSNLLLHHKPMFKDGLMTRRERMFWRINVSVPPNNTNASFPTKMISPRFWSSLLSHAMLLSILKVIALYHIALLGYKRYMILKSRSIIITSQQV